jgi:anti-sigma factor (TIGR02949 family)
MSMGAQITCQQLVELVTDYLDGALTPSDRERFERHLTTCPGCTTYVEQIRETVRLTGERLTEETLPDEMRETLLVQFRDWATTE